MSFRRSKENAQHLRQLRRRREQTLRQVDARIAELTGCRAGVTR